MFRPKEENEIFGAPYPAQRSYPSSPVKVLDAPCFSNDYYYNVLDWSALNCVGIGLKNTAYIYNPASACVAKLLQLPDDQEISHFSFNKEGTLASLGLTSGLVQIWDVQAQKLVRSLTGHTSRSCAASWTTKLLSTGGKDSQIIHRDLRMNQTIVAKSIAHRQEVCGLKWSPDETQLASGSNDNRVMVWDVKGLLEPDFCANGHRAAVKAIAWSPQKRGLLATGGGTADRTIKLWNTQTRSLESSTYTGSQVCALVYAKDSGELVSTHGYSENQINIWSQPRMTLLHTIKSHSQRVLQICASPDGQTVLTGSADETLRFWNLFSKANKASTPNLTYAMLNAIR